MLLLRSFKVCPATFNPWQHWEQMLFRSFFYVLFPLFFRKIQWSFFFLTIWSFLLFSSVLSWATLGKALQGHIKKQVCTECYFLGVSKFVQQLLIRGNTENKITLVKWQTDIVVYFWSKHLWWMLLRFLGVSQWSHFSAFVRLFTNFRLAVRPSMED